jgi:hypothetical protein
MKQQGNPDFKKWLLGVLGKMSFQCKTCNDELQSNRGKGDTSQIQAMVNLISSCSWIKIGSDSIN